VNMESIAIAGGQPVTILPEAGFGLNFTWLPDGNIVYVSGHPNHTGCGYWKVPVDSVTGRPTAQQKKITNWAGFCLDWPTKTADGKKLVFLEKANRGAIHVSKTKNNSSEITAPKLLSLTDASNQLEGWTVDSHSIIFASDRDRVSAIYRQAIDSDNSERIATGVHDLRSSDAISPDGKWILFTTPSETNDPKLPTQLARVPVDGGQVQFVVSGALSGISCARAPSDLCVLKEWSSDRNHLVFSSLDPVKGRIRELFRTPADDDTNWQLSPDGAKIILFGVQFLGVQHPMRIRSLRDQSLHELTGRPWAGINYVTWTSDSKGIYGSTPTQQGDVLLRLDLNGHVQKVWENRGSFQTSALPSPDTEFLAIQSWSLRSNVWMLENP
jgi:Tol biopolymer transport system component